jgi:uncharacterized CHY-type Zn-finger protein
MGRVSRERKEALIAGKGAPFRNPFVPTTRYTCSKCKEGIQEPYVTEHLLKCQPEGAICGRCKKRIPALEFLEHYKNCGIPVKEEESV